jgi:hypothetical protein
MYRHIASTLSNNSRKKLEILSPLSGGRWAAQNQKKNNPRLIDETAFAERPQARIASK